jgi:hypothetical protein
MNYIDFIKEFPDEASCMQTFKEMREKQGVVCKKCNQQDHYWLPCKNLYECKVCKFRMSLKSGTVMENSKLPFQYWFLAMHLMTATKKTISALELQRQLGHKYYEPIWAMMHKVRRVMSKRDASYKLQGKVELDEGFYSTGFTLKIDSFTGAEELLKRGKGSQKKTKVLVMASFVSAPKRKQNAKKYGAKTIPKYIKMSVVDDLATETINREVVHAIDERSTIVTDAYKSYKQLPLVIEKHEEYNLQHFDSEKVLPWVHKSITNSKNLIKAIHHCVWPEYLQNYLDEFCYKANRRYFGEKVFERTLIASVTNTWY